MDDIKKIEEVFAKRCKVEHVAKDAKLKDLGLDSLDVVELLLELETEFGIEFETEEMKNFTTVQDVLDAIEKKLKK